MRCHRALQQLGERRHFVARVDGARAEHDDRLPRGGDDAGGFFHERRIGLGRRVRHGGRQGRDRRPLRHRVPRAFERRRPLPPAQHPREGLVDETGCGTRMLDARGPFDQRLERAELIRQLVQDAVALADLGRRDLAREAQHRRVAGIGGAERRRGVEHARTRHAGIDGGLARRPRVAKRHIGGALLVPCADEADLVAPLVKRVEERVGVRARDAEDQLDAVPDQAVHDGLAGCHGLAAHGTNTTEPKLRRASRSRWAAAASRSA